VPIAAPRVRFELMLRPEDTDAEFERTEKAYEVLSPWLRPDEYRLLRCDVYEWHSITADPWRAGRLFIAGDAAHTMPPHLGLGMCSGIRDAHNLAWKLARVVRGESGEELLDTYESERRPHVATYTTLSAQLANTIETLEATEEEPPVFQAEALRPRLGPGVWDEAADAGGRLSEQPRLSDGRLLDDVVGYRFAVVGDPATVAGLSERSRSLLTALDARIVDDFTGDLRSWVVGQGATAVLVRPDRYLAGAAGGAAELDALVEQVAAAVLPAAVSA
jgi:3-(3-hydroxy-phenyl)propionate hydroxylase